MEEYTIPELQMQMERGETTALALVKAYLTRIEDVDSQTNAVLEINLDAYVIADALDQERATGNVRGPLHGIPILLKDNIDTHDKMQTTSGSLALAGSIPPRDAGLVARLRAAGAIILGKTNLSEWANFRGKRTISGWSSRGGQTRNPYALDRSPSGSSSGSGVAVAANLCAAAVGTETDGSIISPAQTNGIVGIKPTLGLISGRGIIPIAHSQDTAGPMARTVTDATLLLGALAEPIPNAKMRDYTPFLRLEGLQGARIGVARNMAGDNAKIIRVFERALDALRDLGAVVVDPVDVPHIHEYRETEKEVLLYEFKADLNAYLEGLGPNAPVRTMADVIAFNEAHAERVMPWFGQEMMLTAQAKGPLNEPAYLDALTLNQRLSRAEGIDAALASHNLDALVVPSGGPSWLIDPINGDANKWGVTSCHPAAVAGYPHITVPMGYIHGLPIGLSFFAGAWQEGKLIGYAYAFEQATQVRKPPRFLETIAIEN